jgi:hypothetical protein
MLTITSLEVGAPLEPWLQSPARMAQHIPPRCSPPGPCRNLAWVERAESGGADYASEPDARRILIYKKPSQTNDIDGRCAPTELRAHPEHRCTQACAWTGQSHPLRAAVVALSISSNSRPVCNGYVQLFASISPRNRFDAFGPHQAVDVFLAFAGQAEHADPRCAWT